jgi:hypothetical protein
LHDLTGSYSFAFWLSIACSAFLGYLDMAGCASRGYSHRGRAAITDLINPLTRSSQGHQSRTHYRCGGEGIFS